MTYPTRLKLNGITVVALVIALLLVAIAFPTPVAANPAVPLFPGGRKVRVGWKVRMIRRWEAMVALAAMVARAAMVAWEAMETLAAMETLETLVAMEAMVARKSRKYR